MRLFFLFIFFQNVLWAPTALLAQTISEKKASFINREQETLLEGQEELREVNALIEEKRFELKGLYERALAEYNRHSEHDFETLLKDIKALKEEIVQIQKMWKDEIISRFPADDYALWHQPEVNVQELVLDYGSSEFIYLVPPEVGNMRLSINSNLPIPKEAWGECLELILSQYGIGIRELSPYLRELYFLRDDPTGVRAIIEKTEELDFFPPNARICFVITVSGCDPKSDLKFLQRFSNPMTTKIEGVGGKIFITAQVDTVQELLKLYSFAKTAGGRQDFQLVTLSKIDALEMQNILNTAFHDGKTEDEDGSSLRVIPLQNLSQSLFLSGNHDEVEKALKLIEDIEIQIEDPQEKTVFWYGAKHSDAEELATVLAKVYDLLIESPNAKAGNKNGSANGKEDLKKENKLVVPSTQIAPHSGGKTSHKTADGQNNFVVDSKTGSLIMVVEQEALPKIKDLLKKLDVPKKMVRLEVLLFEKKFSNQSKFGLNLLRLGKGASNTNDWGLGFGGKGAAKSGIFEFLLSHATKGTMPAYDIAYQFLLGQEDVQINASPSITTMNQTPATIAIVEETSIDSGADKKHSQVFSRAQYGITIQITPTINFDEGQNAEDAGFITLETDITFDTTKKSTPDRPDVTRRHIKNHVRIADGETLILGGLRNKNTQEGKESIPFLGEIPGIGKLFSHTELSESSTEMFIFITPKIISDPIEDEKWVLKEELKKRPGDIPEFLQELVWAREKQKKKLFEGTLKALFGKDACAPRYAKHDLEEYDGK